MFSSMHNIVLFKYNDTLSYNTIFFSFQSIYQILTISSYGKLLAVAALIWNKENSNAYLILTKIFVITSNAEAIKG